MCSQFNWTGDMSANTEEDHHDTTEWRPGTAYVTRTRNKAADRFYKCETKRDLR